MREKMKMFKYTKAKYEKLYPEATVTKSDIIIVVGYRSWEPIVKVLFKSGSYVEFYLGREKDGEFVKTKIQCY